MEHGELDRALPGMHTEGKEHHGAWGIGQGASRDAYSRGEKGWNTMGSHSLEFDMYNSGSFLP